MSDNLGFSKSVGDIYRKIYSLKTCSRQDLASSLSLSLPTVTQNLKQLQSAGFIFQSGEYESTGGRKPIMYSCTSHARFSMGIDITKNHLSTVLIDLNINIIASRRIRIPYEETTAYFEAMQKEMNEVLSLAHLEDFQRILGIGISMPAIIQPSQKAVSYATVIPVSPTIYKKLAPYMPVSYLLFNDANSAGLAESWTSLYTKPIVYLSLSSSVGGSNINNRIINHGSNWRASEYGHMTIYPRGKKCYCGQRGCLDAYCSSKTLSSLTNGNLQEFFLQLSSGSNIGFRNIFEQYMEDLSIAVNSLRMCYDCDIILGGYVGAYMGDYIDEFREKTIALNPFENDPSFIRVCHYTTEASAVGAAINYIDKFIKAF